MNAEDLTVEQLIEALHAIHRAIAVPLAALDEDEDTRTRILVCRTLAADSYIDALLGITGDEPPIPTFEAWLSGLSEVPDEWPARYYTWDDLDRDAELYQRAQAQVVMVNPHPPTRQIHVSGWGRP